MKRECHPKWQGCVLITVSTNDNLGDYRLKAGQASRMVGQPSIICQMGYCGQLTGVHESLILPSHAVLVPGFDTSSSLVVAERFSARLTFMRLSLAPPHMGESTRLTVAIFLNCLDVVGVQARFADDIRLHRYGNCHSSVCDKLDDCVLFPRKPRCFKCQPFLRINSYRRMFSSRESGPDARYLVVSSSI